MKRVNPVMVTLGRESRRLSQTHLAKKTGMSQGTLSKIEAGVSHPSEEALRKLCAELNYPRSFFLQELRVQQLPLTFFRKRKTGLLVGDIHAARAHINIARLRLEALLRAEEPKEPKLVLFDARGRSGNVERAAAELRVHWNLPPGPIENLTDAIENAGIVVELCDFDTSLIDGLGIYQTTDALPPMIFVNPSIPGDRLRFTLAHELGHIVLHHHLGVVADDLDVEGEADRFAAEFLMPAKDIRGHLYGLNLSRLANLKAHWRVSMRALLKRAQDLGTVGRRTALVLWKQLSSLGGTSELVAIPFEQPKWLRHLVGKHLDEMGYSVSEMGGLLHQSADEFRSQFMVQHLRLAP